MKRKAEWKICESYGTSQLCLGGPTDEFVQHIGKLNRKHCRLSMGFVTGHMRLQCVPSKRNTSKAYSCRKYSTCSAWIPGIGKDRNTDCGYGPDAYSVLERIGEQIVGMVWMDPDQIKISIAGDWMVPINLSCRNKTMGQRPWVLGTHFGNHFCFLNKKY